MKDPLNQVLQLRRAISQSAVAKYQAILDRESDGRVRDTFVFRGASRTGRWSCVVGDTYVRVKTLANLVEEIPITLVNRTHLIWDGEEFVSHEGVQFAGNKEVMTYDGVTATSDHRVFTESGDTITILEAYERGDRLKIADRPPEDKMDSPWPTAGETEHEDQAGRQMSLWPRDDLGGESDHVRSEFQMPSVHQPRARAPVYDIVNCGPRHRFVANGRLVCNSRGVQYQNFKRPPKGSDPDQIAQWLCQGSFPTTGLDGMEKLGGAIRATISASEGRMLVVCDLSSVESRILGWITGDFGIQTVFREGRDPYKDFASRWLHKPYDEVTGTERNLAKPPTLGCGYGLGAKGLQKYAANMGIELDPIEAQSAVTAFRTSYQKVPVFWRWIENAFKAACRGERVSPAYHLQIAREGDMVTIRLPSGRKLYYQYAVVDPGDNSVSYTGQNSFTHKWERIRTYGARLCENSVQAIQADILAHGMTEAEIAGLDVVGHVHDEAIVEIAEALAQQALQRLTRCLTKIPPDMPGLVLEAAGYVANRYRKE